MAEIIMRRTFECHLMVAHTVESSPEEERLPPVLDEPGRGWDMHSDLFVWQRVLSVTAASALELEMWLWERALDGQA